MAFQEDYEEYLLHWGKNYMDGPSLNKQAASNSVMNQYANQGIVRLAPGNLWVPTGSSADPYANEEPVAAAVAAAQQTVVVSNPSQGPVTIRQLFGASSLSVPDPADAISQQVRGDPTTVAEVSEKKTASLLKLAVLAAVIWFLMGVRK